MLEKKGKMCDIITSPEFTTSQNVFKDAVTELKSLGYGYVVNHKEITDPGK